MDREAEVIGHQMEETRTSLQDKLETLEQQVADTVHNTTDAVTETVDSVKEAVRDTVDSVKDALDVRLQVERHPWTMFLGAALVGFVGARLLERALAPRPAGPPPSPSPGPALAVSRNGSFGEELTKVRGLAVSTAGNVVREMLTASAPLPLASHIRELVDEMTVKLGGQPLEGSLLRAARLPAKRASDTKGASFDDLQQLADDGCPHFGTQENETDLATTEPRRRRKRSF